MTTPNVGKDGELPELLGTAAGIMKQHDPFGKRAGSS